MPCYPSSKSHGFLMRVTGRKARDPQAEEINCKWQTSFFFFLLYTKLKGGLFKILCCQEDPWFSLNLTFLKP